MRAEQMRAMQMGAIQRTESAFRFFLRRQIKNKSEYEWNQCSLIQKRTVGVKTKPIICGVRQPGSRFYDVGGVRHFKQREPAPALHKALYTGVLRWLREFRRNLHEDDGKDWHLVLGGSARRRGCESTEWTTGEVGSGPAGRGEAGLSLENGICRERGTT